MIAESSFSNCVFRSNHASNYLPVKAALPQDKEGILQAIDRVLEARDNASLRPEFLRALYRGTHHVQRRQQQDHQHQRGQHVDPPAFHGRRRHSQRSLEIHQSRFR